MKLFRKNLIYLFSTALILLFAPVFIAGSTLHHRVKVAYTINAMVKEEKTKAEIILETADSLYQNFKLLNAGLAQEAFEMGYKGYLKLLDEGMVNREDILTIADFSKPSNQKRLFIIDMKNGKILYHTLVAHGRNSGVYYATDFSNKPESNKSSLGFYLTMQTYFGEKGLSLKLKGLEKGINDNAYDRAIVVHGSEYVTPQFASSNGFLGRSLGCPAVPQKLAPAIIKTIKNGSVLFIYHPGKTYKEKSQIINS